MLTATMLSIMNGTAGGSGIAYMLFAQIVYGIVGGAVIAAISAWMLKRIRFASSGFDAVFVTAVAVLAYAVPAALGGNGYLSVYIVGIVLGNVEFRSKQTMVPFFDGVTGLMQMLLFFLLGLLSFPSRLPAAAPAALLIALFLTFIARPVVIFAMLLPFKSKVNQQLVVSWAGLRGAASIVFAVMAVMAVNTENDLFHIVFCIVLFSILLQGSLLPLLSKKLNMIDENGDVMKTFSDYSNEIPVQFIQFTIKNKHPWCGKTVQDIILPPDTLLVLLHRGQEKIVPNGKTELLCGDALVLSAKSPKQVEGVHLAEKHVDAGSRYVGKRLMDVSTDRNALVILIMRGDDVVIPKGDTVLQAEDTLVINHADG